MKTNTKKVSKKELNEVLDETVWTRSFFSVETPRSFSARLTKHFGEREFSAAAIRELYSEFPDTMKAIERRNR